MTPFLDTDTVALAKSVGFDEAPIKSNFVGTKEEKHSYTLEQVERWLEDVRHVQLVNLDFPFPCDECRATYISYLPKINYLDGRGKNQFSARLAGVKKALEYLKAQK